MDGKTERPALDVEEGHLDGGLGLEAPPDLAIQEGEGDSRDGVVDIGRGHERITRGRIDVAPSLATVVRRDAHEHAALHGGRSVHTVNGALERHLDEDRRDAKDAHGVPSIYRDWHEPARHAPGPGGRMRTHTAARGFPALSAPHPAKEAPMATVKLPMPSELQRVWNCLSRQCSLHNLMIATSSESAPSCHVG